MLMQGVQDCFDDHLRTILTEIAEDNKLDTRPLLGKYLYRGLPDLSPLTKQTYQVPEGPLEIPEPRPLVAPKKKGGRKPKFSTPPDLAGDLTREFLEGLTIPLIKEACKMRKIAVSGGKDDLIKRFMDYMENPEAHKVTKKGGRRKKDQPPEPKHNHELDDKTHSDCEQCQMYGNPMDPIMQEEEFEIARSEKPKETKETEETEETEEDETESIENQLKNIISTMNNVDLDKDKANGDEWDESEYVEPDDNEDPLDAMDYGDDLDFEE
jgi:hypothetical protein